MAQEIEIEFKNLLTEKEYNRLIKELAFPPEGFIQRNHYFETADFQLKNHHAALRIREKNDKFVLTLKEPHPKGLLETHAPLTKQEADSWLAGYPVAKENVEKQLTSLGISLEDLTYYGSLTTERRSFQHANVLLVLDYSKYNGHEDYELELEASSRAQGEQAFNEILKNHEITKRPTPNKIERFFTSRIKKQ